jgi:stress responsive alpha/beta barrel protein
MRLRCSIPSGGLLAEETHMRIKLRVAVTAFTAAALFASGAVFGARLASQKTPANRFGQPKTILQISLLKWKPGVAEQDKQNVLDGVKELAAQIPGIKNIWTRVVRMQPRDYDAAFVIEFASREAADNYAEHPAHEAWSKKLVEIREDSISPQVSN